MDNGGYNRDPEKGTELSLVENSHIKTPGDSEKASKLGKHTKNNHPETADTDHETTPIRTKTKNPANADPNTPSSYGGGAGASGSGGGGGQQPEPGPSTSCRPEVCQRARERYTAPDLRGSPWHRSKTIFLLITISSLIIWAIIYSTLSHLNLV